MKSSRKCTYFFSLLAATLLTFTLLQNEALAEAQSGPNRATLDRLEAFVLELEAIDVQVEELENPSLGNKVLDAIGVELCGFWTIIELGGEITLPDIGLDSEVSVGLGPNFMGTGIKAKVEPGWELGGQMASQTMIDGKAEICVSIYDVVEIIIQQNQAAEAGAHLASITHDASLDPLEAFVYQLSPDARNQILAFADQSPIDLLELLVLLLQNAGIDPNDPNSLADSLLAPVDAISSYAEEFSPEKLMDPASILDLDRTRAIVESVPFGTGLQTAFTGSLDAISSFGFDDLNPCGNTEFLPGLEDLRDAVCGIESLYTNSAGYMEQLDGVLSGAADDLDALASNVEGGVGDLKSDLTSVFGDLETMFSNIQSNVCRGFSASWSKSVKHVFSCSASVSFNPCDVSITDPSPLSISAGCSW